MVTFDENDWSYLRSEFETILAYLENSYSYQRNSDRIKKLVLPRHSIDFTTSYGVKCVIIEKTPEQLQMDESQSLEEPGEEPNNSEPSCKKRKTHPPTIVMQATTFEGLWNQSHLVDLRYDILKQLVGKINRTIDLMMEYLKNTLVREHGDN